jgi:hypothetical protein
VARARTLTWRHSDSPMASKDAVVSAQWADVDPVPLDSEDDAVCRIDYDSDCESRGGLARLAAFQSAPPQTASCLASSGLSLPRESSPIVLCPSLRQRSPATRPSTAPGSSVASAFALWGWT